MRLIYESSSHTYGDVQRMYPEEIARELDFRQIARDRQLWQHGERGSGG